jgi:hypothetical protein
VFPSGIVAENSRDISFTGCTAGPCPNCGGTGEVPDGVYDFVGDTIRVVASTGYSRQQLERLAALVVQAREARTPAADVVATLEREAPELAGLAKRLLVPKTPADLAAWLTLLLMVLQMFIARPASEVSEKDVERLTERAVERAIKPPARAPQQADRGQTPEVKRPPPPPRKQREARKRQRRRP